MNNKYANTPGFIAPYQGIPYRTNQIPSGYHRRAAKELFNQRHSSLRNATDRIFWGPKGAVPHFVVCSSIPITNTAEVGSGCLCIA